MYMTRGDVENKWILYGGLLQAGFDKGAWSFEEALTAEARRVKAASDEAMLNFISRYCFRFHEPR
jgi:hypothetical protein